MSNIYKSSNVSSKNNSIYGSASPCKAYVVANFGDPGLSTDVYCDIRSRFVLAIKDPLKRPLVPISNTNGDSVFLQDNMILVLRPEQLWISCPADQQPNGVDLNLPVNASYIRRMDSNGNINIGSYSNFTESNILPINNPYKLGEEITVQRLQDYKTADEREFTSIFSMNVQAIEQAPAYASIIANKSYEGQSLPNVLDENGKRTSGGRDGTGFIQGVNYFLVRMHKYAYSQFLSIYYENKFDPKAYMPPNYEYYFTGRDYITFRCCSYIDLNIGGKARDGSVSCMPSIITPPDSFLTPQTRNFTYLYYTKI
jgi:hypothetical protein